MREIIFYRTSSDKCPVEDFLDTLNNKQVEKALWVIRLVKELDFVPKEYFNKLVNTDNIWEIRVKSGINIFRILGFIDSNNIIVLTNGFVKKTQKTPKKEIVLAERRKKDYLERKNNG